MTTTSGRQSLLLHLLFMKKKHGDDYIAFEILYGFIFYFLFFILYFKPFPRRVVLF
jgi:hypothetical protein